MFTHLRLHTEFSLVDGTVRVKPLMEAVARMNMSAVALTDQSNLFAAVKFYRAAVAGGIKPILGADLLLRNPENSLQPYRFTALCQTNEGYRQLTTLVSKAYREGQAQGLPVVEWDWLVAANQGLIILSGAHEGDVGRLLLAEKNKEAEECLKQWQEVFSDRFYIELQRVGQPQESQYLQAVLPLAAKLTIPVVATNNVRFLTSDDFTAHETRTCIHAGYVLADAKRPKYYTEQQYLRSPEEMTQLFADIPSAIQNTEEIAKRCNVELTFGENYLPAFPIPDNNTEANYLAQQAKKGLEQRLASLFDNSSPDFAEIEQTYQARLQIELDVINAMGFAGYFLIVADFIQWAKQHGIPVGPGRGSGAGSLVAYSLLITDIDPIEHDLLFERFLNPERVSMPDFDIDFCMQGRDKVIDYVAQRYGKESVAQIITYGTLAAKAVVRDVGRVLGHPYGFVDQLAKLIPFELGITLDKALEQEPILKKRYEEEEEVSELINLAKKLEGITRNAGTHAGGLVIAPGALTNFTALYCESQGADAVTQFDKDDVESIGLVKFDFLGLRTLTIIDHAVHLVNGENTAKNKPLININQIPLKDEKTFALFKACQTTAVFQLESRGIKDLIKRLQPDSFADIVALVALYRPGPLQSGMVDDFIDRKHGRARVEYPHPKLEPILRETYGVILYQEQVMQIAQDLAGYTLGGADLLRRAMGKKKPEEMAKQRAIFLNGATENGVDATLANSIFDLMEKFAGYGFNKSHSVAYALLAYQTAWLKAHFPAAFMAAVLSSDMDHTDKVVMFLEECKALKLTVNPPHVNQSVYAFTVVDEHSLNYGLGAVKGLGESVITAIVEARKADGKFTGLFDLCQRLDNSKLNRRGLEALIKAGALDDMGAHRAMLMANIDQALQLAQKAALAVTSGQGDLFSDALGIETEIAYLDAPAWDNMTCFQAEKQTLGWYVSGHPLMLYKKDIEGLITAPLAKLTTTSRQKIILAGLIHGLRLRRNKNGDRIAIVSLEDDTGRIEVAVFAKTYAAYGEFLQKECLVIVEGEISLDGFTGEYRVTANQVMDLETARQRFAKALLLKVNGNQVQAEQWQMLNDYLQEARGGECPVIIHFFDNKAEAKLQLNGESCVKLTSILLERLRGLLGEQAVRVEFNA